LENKSKIICKSNFRNLDKAILAAELTEKIAKLICRMESASFIRKT